VDDWSLLGKLHIGKPTSSLVDQPSAQHVLSLYEKNISVAGLVADIRHFLRLYYLKAMTMEPLFIKFKGPPHKRKLLPNAIMTRAKIHICEEIPIIFKVGFNETESLIKHLISHMN